MCLGSGEKLKWCYVWSFAIPSVEGLIEFCHLSMGGEASYCEMPV